MSDLLNGVPCQYCNKYYGHSETCFSNTQTGVAEKMMFLEIEKRHSMICHNLQSQLSECQEKLNEAERTIQHFENSSLWQVQEKLKVAEIALSVEAKEAVSDQGLRNALAKRLFDTIKHGDDEHKEWLAKELEKFFKAKIDH